MSAGDVRFVIKLASHATFTRRGDNLYMKEAITLLEALTGFEHTIKHMDGESVTLKRTHITPPGYIQQMDGQGMPLADNPTRRGKLFVEYTVVFPTSKSFTQEEKQSTSSHAPYSMYTHHPE